MFSNNKRNFIAAQFLMFALLLAVAGIGSAAAFGPSQYAGPQSSQVAGAAFNSDNSAPGAGCDGNWKIVPSANPHVHNHLLAIEPVAGNDVWAVGYYYEVGQAPDVALIMHYDGSQWSEYALPSPIVGRLNGISRVSASDIWAVGWTNGDPDPDTSTLTMHWDGSTWSRVASPTVEGISELNDVTAIATDNVWAVGFVNGTHGTLVEHWNGSAWSIVPSPPQSFSDNYILNEVAAVSASDIWAVGLVDQGSGFGVTLIEHWNGSAWSIVPSPNPGGYYNRLDGVVASAANDVWAAGSYGYPAGSSVDQTLVLHWNGSVWSIVPSPSPGASYNALRDITALAPNDVWAVGYSNDDIQLPDYTLTEHWDGMAWSVIASPNSQRRDTSLWGVAARAGVVWAVGKGENKYDNAQPWDTFVLRQLCDSGTPTPTGTAGASTATSTATTTSVATTPSTTTTSVPTASATACTITFTDVDETNVFYSFIRCLACRGIISGYDDGTFRPFNDITRGQIAKIVSNAAGFNEDPGPQIYEDVPEGSPFYAWINRLSMRGHIGGYPCGTVDVEPCVEPDNLPYFRPSNSATRGQLAKIVANAAGLDTTPTGVFYTDVQEDHPFYLWIMRLTELAVMSGYDCGGEGEPCDNKNRPYFRPFNNVTRGQASKIVANTFIPACEAPSRR
jgi:hypothetical protein